MSVNPSEPSKTQAKKTQRDAERRKDRGKKRKMEDTEEEAQADQQKDFLPLEAGLGSGAQMQGVSQPAKKKSRKSQSRDQDQDQAHAESEPVKSAARSAKRKKPNTEAATEDKPSKSRFIVFIGNLPYSATDASLQIHFKKLAPFTLRHRIDPKTKKSKGFAFLEFENFDRMKTCLKLYHHSMFDPEAKESTVGDGSTQEREGAGATKKDPKRDKRIRRINVELTAGGGGKNDNRKEKIKAKNVRLEDQRKRRAELERKERAKAEGKQKQAANKSADTKSRDAPDAGDEQDAEAMSGIHPSRLARLNA